MELCAGCWEELPRNPSCCRRCAIPLPQPGVCGRCQAREPTFTAAFVPFLYQFPFDAWIPALKFHRELSLARLLGQLLALELRNAIDPEQTPNPGTLIPVPLHRSRLRERGYNQAREIAATAARLLDRPLRTPLQRIRATPAQTHLKAADRIRNVRGSFATTGPVSGSITLLDDVVTTGATANEIAKTLRHAGAVEVTLLAVARVLPPR